MPAIDLFVREGATLFAPADSGPAEIDPINLAWDRLALGDVKQVQLISGELIARQRIRPRMQNGPPAPLRRRFDKVHFLSLSWLDAKGHEHLRIGRPLRHPI